MIKYKTGRRIMSNNSEQNEHIKRHAYLIVAHNEFNMLKLLIASLDDCRNDIYIMVDAKANSFEQKDFYKITKYSNVFFIKRIKSYWSAYVHLKAYIMLFKESYRKKYEYYHVISGVDIPLKTQDEIHTFFENNAGKEFIMFNKSEYRPQTVKEKFLSLFRASIEERGNYRFFAQRHLNWQRMKSLSDLILGGTGRILLAFQKIFHITCNNDITIYHGADWFSITHDLVGLILEKEIWIEKHFHISFCPSEFFVQTIVMDSGLKENIYENGFMRHIDWNRSKSEIPYIFKIADYEELVNSDNFFARKFSTLVDKEIIRKLYYRLLPAEVVDDMLK
jgi:hypothetical protein